MPRKRNRTAEWKQAAGVEAGLRREFLSRAEAAEGECDLKTKRTAWIRKRHEKHLADYHFANGFRAGLECALLALDGRDVMGNSIDAQERKNDTRSR